MEEQEANSAEHFPFAHGLPMTSCVKADDRGHAGWQFAPCLSIVSKSLPRQERAGADVSAFDVRNLCPRAGPTAATAGGVATLSSQPINIPTIWLTSSTSLLLRRKMADTVAGKRCMAKMRRTRSSRSRWERSFTNCGMRILAGLEFTESGLMAAHQIRQLASKILSMAQPKWFDCPMSDQSQTNPHLIRSQISRAMDRSY